MGTAYVVEKYIELPVEGFDHKVSFYTVEGLFTTEKLANEYIKRRKASKDRDDRGCKFKITPWSIMDSLNISCK